VVDGDTFYINGVEPAVRVWGIDAPEAGTDLGEVATLLMTTFARGRIAECIIRDRDRYGRIVASCMVDGIEIASAMVRFGMARDWPRYSGGAYAEEEAEARRERRGMWR